ncbi:MAG TPA: alpha/beta hydrolase [Candidatus Melainabacteria bacterium]|nr:alpha/beta hydrolase [Candidatus Melainabacteria bacterium]
MTDTTATASAPARSYVHVPDTISAQAQDFLRTMQDPHLIPRFPDADDLAGWVKLQAWAEADGKARSEVILKRYAHTVTELKLGGVPVLDVRPQGWKDNGKVLVYTHGGAHVMYSAASMLGRAVVAASEMGLRVLSIDYTLAPHAKYNQMSDQVVTAIEALLEQGQILENTAIFGDSSGGGLAAAVTLKMRDRGIGLPAAAVLVSPWLDVTSSGDTETTLYDADPNQLYDLHGKYAAAAFADPKDQKHPYASPVYGDFSKGFPPTLIQGGLKETLLSGFVRLYQALDAVGVPVKLDIYEGMVHNFQDRIPDAPEAILARQKMRTFLRQHLKM